MSRKDDNIEIVFSFLRIFFSNKLPPVCVKMYLKSFTGVEGNQVWKFDFIRYATRKTSSFFLAPTQFGNITVTFRKKYIFFVFFRVLYMINKLQLHFKKIFRFVRCKMTKENLQHVTCRHIIRIEVEYSIRQPFLRNKFQYRYSAFIENGSC